MTALLNPTRMANSLLSHRIQSCGWSSSLCLFACAWVQAQDAGVQLANTYFERGELQKTETVLADVIKDSPGDFAAHHLLGRIYTQNKRYAEAEEHLKAAIAANPESSEALRDLGEVYRRTQNRPAALEYLSRSVAIKPDQPTTQYDLGMLHLEGGDARSAARHLELARTYGLGHTGVLIHLAKAYLKLQQTEEGLDTLHVMLEKSPREAPLQLEAGKILFENLMYEEARGPLRTAWELSPDSYEAAFYVALVHYLLGEQEASLSVLLKLRASGNSTPEVVNLLGAVRAKMGETDEAVNVLRGAIDAAPERPDAYFNLGLILLERGDRTQANQLLERGGQVYRADAKVFYILSTQQACADVRQQLEKSPATNHKVSASSERASFYVQLGKAFQERLHFTTAAELLRNAWQLNPDDPDTLLLLGISCYNLAEQPSALAMFRKAATLRPNLDTAYYFLGNAYMSVGTNHDAIEAYRQAIRIAPSNPLYHYRLGRALFREERLDEALEAFGRALSLSPDSAATHSGLGRVCLKLKQEERAVAEFQEAIRLDPGLAEPYYYLARYYAQQGELPRAREFSAAFQRKAETARKIPGRSGYIRADE